MAHDEDEDDVYDDEFDFVDDKMDDDVDDDTDEPVESESAEPVEEVVAERDDYEDARDAGDDSAIEDDPYAVPPPAANYVVHIYEYRQYRRTIDRPFTGEDAEAFASEYNRTAKPYGRFAVAGKNDAKPHKNLDDR